MKTLFFSILLISILAFSPNVNKVKMIDNPQQVDVILELEEVILNRISCELENGGLCPLEIDKKEISVECSCEDAKMLMEPNLEALGKWNQKESEAVITYAHEYFSSNSFIISEIKFLKANNLHYLFVQLIEKLNPNRILFTIEK